MRKSSATSLSRDSDSFHAFPQGNLGIETCSTPDLRNQFSSVAIDPSVRLTPSPHRSRVSSPAPSTSRLDDVQAQTSSQRPDMAHQPLGQFHYDPADSGLFPSVWGVGLPGGLTLWPLNFRTTLGSTESRWAFARRGPASNPAARNGTREHENLGDAGVDGLGGPSRRASDPAQQPTARVPGNGGPFAQVPRADAAQVPIWRVPFAKEPIAARREGGRLLESGPEWRTTGRQGSQSFGVRQAQALLRRDRVSRPLSEAAVENAQKSQPVGFQPMMAVAEPERRRNSLAAMQMLCRDSGKFSSRYHGMHTESNASADYLGPGQNCALWLTNLPADVEYSELLKAIDRIGRIWCTYINLPDNIHHRTAAAKVVFFTPEAAQKLLTQSWTKSIVVRGYRVRVAHNRIKYGKNIISGKMSRVLIITGKQDFVNPENLRKWFRERFVFQEDTVIELIKAAGRAVCEFRFGSYRCQAQMGKMALEKDMPAGFEKVEFADDPCEVGENLASYGIAAERIQGKGL